MNNFSKKILIIAFFVSVGLLTVGLTSCKEEVEGGTIIVKCIYRDYFYRPICIADNGYNRVTGSVGIDAGETKEFVVNDNGSYWVCYDNSGQFSPIKKVSVSGGEAVTVTIGD
jgi:hypothetical protein